MIKMDYPLLINGKEAGRLRVSCEGLYTVFEAQCSENCDGLTRLWVHGKEGSAYLGIPEPAGSGMYLRKRLTRSELEAFPKSIICASNSEGLHNKEKDEAQAETSPETDRDSERVWFRGSGGSLISQCGDSLLIAIPENLRTEKPGLRRREIEGKKYIIFRY